MGKASYPLPNHNGIVLVKGLSRPIPASIANAIQTLSLLEMYAREQLKTALEKHKTEFSLTEQELTSILHHENGMSGEDAQKQSKAFFLWLTAKGQE